MRRFTSGALLLLALAACQSEVQTPQVGAPDPDDGSYQMGGGFIEGELVVGYRDGADVAGIAHKLSGSLKTDWPQIKAALIALPEGLTVPKAQAGAQRLRGLRYAEPNYLHRLEDPASAGSVTPTLRPAQVSVPDPDFEVQWLHRQMESEEAWAQGVSGEGIRIGIHDDFIDHRHPDLVDNIFYPGFDGFKAATLGADDPIEDAFITPDTPHDGVGFHGTSVAGTAAAVSNELGGLGTAYGASIVPLAINEPEEGALVDAAIINSAIFAVLGPDLAPGGDDRAPGTDPDTGPYVHIVNMSWGSGSYSQVIKDTVDFMLASGIVLVTSAGNTPAEGPSFPAWNPGLINVAATTPRGGRTSFSNRGLHLDVAAPGENIWTTTTRNCIYATPDGSSCEDENAYTYESGTSFSSPAAAGTAALVLEAAAERDAEGNITALPSAAQVRRILEETASKPGGYDRSALGAGIVDSEAAVARALEAASDPVADGGSLVVNAVLRGNPEIQVPSVGLTLIPDEGEGAVEYTQTSDGALLVPQGLGLFQQLDAGDYTLQASGPYTSVYDTAAATAETELEITPGGVTEVQLELDVDTFDDPFEPNASPVEAAELEAAGVSLRASLYDASAGSDVDVYALPVNEGESYRVNYETVTGSADVALTAYAEDGSVLAENDDNQAFTTDPLVQFEAPEDGVVYLEVGEVSGLPGTNSPFNLYDLDVAPVSGEEEEPNGSSTVVGTAISDLDVADAQEIDPGVALDAALDPEDTDSFRVTVAAGETLVADVETAEQYLPDTVLAIYDEVGQQVVLNDDSATVDSRVLYTSETGGTYYVVVVPFDPSNPLYASEGDYGLMVTVHLNPPTE